MTNGYLRGAVS